MRNENEGFLLDTNAWFWLVTADSRLQKKQVDLLEKAAQEKRLFISQISFWEIALKFSKGKIQLNRPIGKWLTENSVGLRVLDLPLEISVESTQLPGEFHKDPADRFLVASARCRDLTLVTGDLVILEYAKGAHIKVLPV